MPLSSWTLINVSANSISRAGATSEATEEKNLPEFLKRMQLFFFSPCRHIFLVLPLRTADAPS